MPYVEEAGFTFLRFPGGNWGDEYLLTEARFDEFVALARDMNSEPMVNVKLYKVSPERAAKWVEYANVTPNTASSTGGSATSRVCTRAIAA